MALSLRYVIRCILPCKPYLRQFFLACFLLTAYYSSSQAGMNEGVTAVPSLVCTPYIWVRIS
jgi:hypothetical protein